VRPVARDWSELFITAAADQDEPEGERSPERAGRERGGLLRRLRESMAMISASSRR
jgi:hypothetical protein